MKYTCRIIFSHAFLILALLNGLSAQPWNFVKEKDGIKLYTRNELKSSLKSTKGEAIFHAPIEKVFSLLAKVNNTDWWDKDISEIKVLSYKENIYIQYYIIYDMPWPVADRDFVIESRISADPVTGDRTIFTKTLPNTIPEKPDLVRIGNYWQKWTVQPMDQGYVHVVLEGFVDPGGNLPAGLYNMIVTESPLKTIRSLRNRAMSDKRVN